MMLDLRPVVRFFTHRISLRAEMAWRKMANRIGATIRRSIRAQIKQRKKNKYSQPGRPIFTHVAGGIRDRVLYELNGWLWPDVKVGVSMRWAKIIMDLLEFGGFARVRSRGTDVLVHYAPRPTISVGFQKGMTVLRHTIPQTFAAAFGR